MTQEQRPRRGGAEAVDGDSLCPDPIIIGPPVPPEAGSDLATILTRLAVALERQAAPPRLAYRLSELAAALGVSRRILERERAAGRLPRPDLHIGRVPLWRVETAREWLAKGDGR